MTTISRNITHRIGLPTLASLPVEKGRRRRRRREIRKERTILPGVHDRRKTNLGGRTQQVSKTKTRSSKAFLKHYERSARKRQAV
jgi:hypothetical protein